MKFYISGQQENYGLLEEMLVDEGFEYCPKTSTEDEPGYTRGYEAVNLRKALVIYQNEGEEGFLCPSEGVLLLDENTPSFPLIQRMAEILAPCEYPSPANSIKIEVPESLKKYQVSAEH
jgi:hypothetical protein